MTSAPTLERGWTAEELDSLEDAGHYELVNGRLVERSMSFLSSGVTANVNAAVTTFVYQRGLGMSFESELGIRIHPTDRNHTRRADGGFIARERAPAGDPGFLRVPPDLVVEVVSPSVILDEVFAKVAEWLAFGVRVVWVVLPTQRRVEVHRLGQRPIIFLGDDELTSEDILPGFRVPVSSLFPLD